LITASETSNERIQQSLHFSICPHNRLELIAFRQVCADDHTGEVEFVELLQLPEFLMIWANIFALSSSEWLTSYCGVQIVSQYLYEISKMVLPATLFLIAVGLFSAA